ncbi:hypothetical protein SAMN05421505_103104 [Sinosporangium album]|uniref:RelA/SpoT domain-containing protein n=1 Tax=Sinosporangium album TaxID=504805 RepID=A0A1G7T585_9ACTN|nr:hypothetical protein [Sinosporangium album]SDG30184.1 hypothetical protein SAMN05421505_103104 [Sinosporangium album]
METVRGIGFQPSGRIKNTGTILEKLRRHGGSLLKSIQDLAGARIVLSGGRALQNHAIARIVNAFTSESRELRLVDRRTNPSHGYRAVHVIVNLHEAPVEIQVRTHWQHEWADMFEKLADRVGRGIRYGEPPTRWTVCKDDRDAAAHAREYEVRASVVAAALSLSESVKTLEEAELTDGRSGSTQADEMWREVHGHLIFLQELIGRLVPVPETTYIGKVDK